MLTINDTNNPSTKILIYLSITLANVLHFFLIKLPFLFRYKNKCSDFFLMFSLDCCFFLHLSQKRPLFFPVKIIFKLFQVSFICSLHSIFCCRGICLGLLQLLWPALVLIASSWTLWKLN